MGVRGCGCRYRVYSGVCKQCVCVLMLKRENKEEAGK